MARKTTQPKLNKFGWCIESFNTTNAFHEQCRKEYYDWNKNLQVCECKCHKKKNK